MRCAFVPSLAPMRDYLTWLAVGLIVVGVMLMIFNW
jgi:hypothetical protein